MANESVLWPNDDDLLIDVLCVCDKCGTHVTLQVHPRSKSAKDLLSLAGDMLPGTICDKCDAEHTLLLEAEIQEANNKLPH